MSLEGFEPVINEPKVEWNDGGSSNELRRFLLYANAVDPSSLRVFVTDFCSNHWEAVRSYYQLEDMRDNTGIGGSWSDFIAYIVASLKSEDVKLSLQGHSSGGAASAKLTGQKAKGMPRISFSLSKVMESAAAEATANFSFELFRSFKSTQQILLQEQECIDKLKKELSAEKERNQDLQSQLDLYSKRQKLSNMNGSEKAGISVSQMSSGQQNSPDKTVTQDPASKKLPKRAMPAYRRAKLRGARLQDTDEDKDS